MSVAKRFIATTDVRHNRGRNVAIIGGGIGGLTAALAFARREANVTVYEQAPALTAVGAGVQITPNGMRVLHTFGLTPALALAGVEAEAVVPVDAMSGEAIARFDLSTQKPRYIFCHRAALINLLARGCAAQNVRIVLNAKITSPRPSGAFEAPEGIVKPDLTIGADGIRSVVRSQVTPSDKPFFTRQVAWRAIVPQDHAEPVARIWMAKGRHVVTYPLSESRMNVVAVQARKTWADEGWHYADHPDNMRVAFADTCVELQSILEGADDVRLWGLFRHPVATQWSAGSIVLLGDAAHPTLPFLAQGANLAIEDAYALARICNEHADLEIALGAYEAARRPRVVRAIKTANRNARSYHLGGLPRHVAHTGLRLMGQHAPDAFLRRLSWLYDHDVTA